MVHELRVIILCFCITFLFSFRADAQQTPPNVNPNKAQIQQLREDMQGVRKQLEPLRAQMQQLMTQVKALKEQIRPLQEKLRADREQMRALRGEHGQNPAGPTTSSATK